MGRRLIAGRHAVIDGTDFKWRLWAGSPHEASVARAAAYRCRRRLRSTDECEQRRHVVEQHSSAAAQDSNNKCESALLIELYL